ncbi:MAG: undecaprenyl-diphosphate phosphatase [Gammaproteobacteria bacterium]|nr:undecaprenyl-diphosphate phosphatase [Gammaproteobacteria bacterium]
MDLLQVIVLALIQGITEFLPVSSSAHLILPSLLTTWTDQGLLFDVAVHLGSLAAAVVYFRDDLIGFGKSAWRWVATRDVDEDATLLLKLAIATIPIAVLGLSFKTIVETELRNVAVIASTTIIFALALWWADAKARGDRREQTLTYPEAFLIGAAQALALIPGTSRSGITITAALLVGLGREGAARFSFLLAIPTISGAALLTAFDAVQLDGPVPWLDVTVGFAIAGVSAYACIAAFIALVNRTGMTPYVMYRLLLGGLLLWFV